MAIDMRDLPLGLGSRGEGEGFASGGSKLALARRRVVDAWLDDDAAGLAGAIDQGEREFGGDLDGLAGFRTSITPLADEFRTRRQLARGGAERDEARSGLAATLGRLSQSVAASDDPARRDLLGREARGLIESHRAGGLLDPDDAEALAGEYDKGLGQAQAARIARDDPALARQLLRDESLFPGLDPETRERYAKAAEARIAAREEPDDGRAAELTAGVTARARVGADLGRRVKAGEADSGDVAAAEQLGEIDPATARRLRANIESARKARHRETDGIARIEAAFAEGRKIDPNHAGDRAALDAHYRLARKGWDEAGLAPDQVRGSLVDYIVESGIVPSNVLLKLPFYFDQGTPEQKWEAADLIQLLIERDFDPQEIPIEYRRKALGIAELASKGYEPTQAVEQYEILNTDLGDPAAEGERLSIYSPEQTAGSRDTPDSTDRPTAVGGGDQKFASQMELDALISLLEEALRSPESANGSGGAEGDTEPRSAYRITPTPAQPPLGPSPVPPPASPTPPNGPKATPRRPTPKGRAGVAAAIIGILGALLRGKDEPETAPAEIDSSAEPPRDQSPSGRAPGDQSPIVAPPAPATVPPTQEPAPEADGGVQKAPPSFGDALEQSILERWSEIEARRAILPGTIPGKKYGGRGDPETQEEVRVIAEACKEVADTEFPEVTYDHYAGGTKNGKRLEEGGEKLPEKRIPTPRKEGDTAGPEYYLSDYSATVNGERGHINNASRYRSGNVTKQERDAARGIEEIADETIVMVGKRDENESWEEFRERAKDACREMISGARDRGFRKALEELREREKGRQAKEPAPEDKIGKRKAEDETNGR